jgi:hypothetical protein
MRGPGRERLLGGEADLGVEVHDRLLQIAARPVAADPAERADGGEAHLWLGILAQGLRDDVHRPLTPGRGERIQGLHAQRRIVVRQCPLAQQAPSGRAVETPQRADGAAAELSSNVVDGGASGGVLDVAFAVDEADAGPGNQRLNGTRVAHMSDTQPIHLNSAPLGIGRM